MAIFNVPAPIMDRGLQQALMGFAQPFAQGLAIRGQQGLQQQDQAAIQQYLQQNQLAQQTQLGQGVVGPQLPSPQFPQFQSQQFQNMAGQGLMNQLFGQQQQQQPGFTLGPGQQRFGPGGQPIAQVAPTQTPTAPTTRVIDDELFQYNPQSSRFESTGIKAKPKPTDIPSKIVGETLYERNPESGKWESTGIEAVEKPTAREKEIDRIQKRLTVLDAKQLPPDPRDQKERGFLEKRLQSALYGDVPATTREEIAAQGYSAEATQRILDIKNGLQPGASSRVIYDTMSLPEKRKYLSAERQRAEGQYFGIKDGNVEPRQPEYLDWIKKEQVKVQKELSKMQQGGQQGTPSQRPAAYPDAVWSPEHGMWTVTRDGRLKGIQ